MVKRIRYRKPGVLRYTLIIILLLVAGWRAGASHIYGMDLFYTHVSGNTYNVTMNVYGDCSASNLSLLTTSSPVIHVFNGNTHYSRIELTIQSPTSGVEVTPVCPSQVNNTACNNGSIPGVKKFVYTGSVTLNTTSATWRFRFADTLTDTIPLVFPAQTHFAGRSQNITNIFNPGGTVINLEATLNNTNGPNSSPTYTTIPTPFFCINKAASYNPGTVDANNDSLVYQLVPGLISTGTVSYLSGYSATSPLAVSTGSFSFNTQTGQLNFTPNLVQEALVVNKVSEYKNGVLVGTSMREMTFVVLNNCNNNPPGGKITNNNTGKVDTAGVTINLCQSSGLATFNINPTDLDTDVINVTYSGLPAGATFTVTNNNTIAPTGTFSWNVSFITPGAYNFFVTYTDQGCPLSSKQTIAYTLNVLPKPSVAIAIVAPATCTKKAVITMTPSVSPSPWRLQVFQGVTQLHNFTNVTGAQTDSLAPGQYIIRVTNSDTCFKDTLITIAPPPPIGISLAVTPPKCHNDTTGVVVVTASGGLAPYKYAIGAGPFGTSNVFTGQAGGLQTFKIKDSNECIKDTLILIPNPQKVGADIVLNKPPCNYYNSGVITVTGKNTKAPYTYAFGAGPFTPTNVFSGLYSGSYSVRVKDSNSCILDTLVVLPDSVKVTATALLTNILCNGDSTGAITLNASGATAPYRYQRIGAGTLSPVNTFNNLPAGTHNFHIEDTNKCYLDTAIALTQPSKLSGLISVLNTLCFGDTNGSITVNGNGGVPPYTYALGAGSYGSGNVFSALGANSYTLHIKDNNGCVHDTVTTVSEPSKLAFDSVLVTHLKCNGIATGEVRLSGNGGVPPFQYAVNASAYTSSRIFNGLSATTYVFHVRDQNNCTLDSVVTLNQPARIVPAALVKSSSCTPLNNGSITMTPSGGVPGYRYALGTGTYSTNPVFTPLAAGSYFIRVRDTNSCIVDTTIVVPDSFVVSANISAQDARCFDSASGIISALGKGGTQPYAYALNTGTYSGLGSFGGLKANTYVLHVKDAAGCQMDTNITINQPSKITSSVTLKQPTCNGYNNGEISVVASGGTPIYGFAINQGPMWSFGNFSALKAGSHIITIKDINDCYYDTTVVMGEPPGMKFKLEVTHLRCYGDSSGTIYIDGSGGTPPFAYTFDNNPYVTTPTLVSVSAGSHTVKMKDGNGCIKDTTVILTEPAQLLVLNPVLTHPTCEGYADGAIKVYGNGGVQPYEFSVNSGPYGSSNNFPGLKEGPNRVRIKDIKQCTYDTTFNLVGYPHIIYEDIFPEPVTCFGGSDGRVTLNVSGGIQALLYSIEEGGQRSTPVFDSLAARQYTFRVTDSAGCVKDTLVTVETPEEIKIETLVTPNDCEGYDNTGRIEAVVSGGTPGYRYAWNTMPEQYNNVVEAMANGTYLVTVTDANDCVDTASASIEYNNCCIVFIPDAFTPNNDGLNDVARIRVKGIFTLKTFAIFNRFGERVFQTNNIEEGWNGIYKGTPQLLGTYNYFVQGICGDNSEQVMYKGTITLIR